MIMFEELIKSLREDHGKQYFARDMEAADAIEHLEAQHYLMKKTAEWLAELLLAEKVPQWVPVTEMLPEDYEQVLTCDEHGNIHIMVHTKEYKFPFGINPEHSRYFMPKWWMPLPEVPKDGA